MQVARSRSTATAGQATHADYSMAVPARVLEEVGPEVAQKLAHHKISNMYQLKSLLQDTVGQEQVGLVYGEVATLRKAVDDYSHSG